MMSGISIHILKLVQKLIARAYQALHQRLAECAGPLKAESPAPAHGWNPLQRIQKRTGICSRMNGLNGAECAPFQRSIARLAHPALQVAAQGLARCERPCARRTIAYCRGHCS